MKKGKKIALAVTSAIAFSTISPVFLNADRHVTYAATTEQTLNTATSIVDWMKANNMDSSFENRLKLAGNHGIVNFRGTALQNVQLLSILEGNQTLHTTTSIVDWMKANGMDSSFENRKNLAKEHGIKNYRGTAVQNIQLLSILKENKQDSPKADGALNSATSIVDWMKANDMDSSFENRLKLANEHGITDYTGTAEQNMKLLGILKGTIPANAPAKDKNEQVNEKPAKEEPKKEEPTASNPSKTKEDKPAENTSDETPVAEPVDNPTKPEQPAEPETPVEEPAQPEQPAEPETPAEPEQPVEEPETPAEPEQPVEEPETPAEPEQPVEEPETPAEPEQPVEEPETPAEPEQPVEEPETPAEPEQPVEEPETPAEPEQPVEEPETPAEPEIPVYDGITYEELLASTDNASTITWEGSSTVTGLDGTLTDGSSYMAAVEGTSPSQYTFSSPTNIGKEMKVFEAEDDSDRIGQIIFDGGFYYTSKNSTFEMRVDYAQRIYGDTYEEALETARWEQDVREQTTAEIEQAIRHVANAAYGAGTPEAEELYNYLNNAKGVVTINFNTAGQAEPETPTEPETPVETEPPAAADPITIDWDGSATVEGAESIFNDQSYGSWIVRELLAEPKAFWINQSYADLDAQLNEEDRLSSVYYDFSQYHYWMWRQDNDPQNPQYYYKENMQVIEGAARHIADAAYGKGTSASNELYNYIINSKGPVTINFK